MSMRHAIQNTTRSLSANSRTRTSHVIRALHSFSRHQPARVSTPLERTRRSYATPPPQVKHSDLPVEKYHKYSDATMDTMLENLENLLDEIGDPEYEVEYGSGVLTLMLGNKGTYVINKQPPNKQIWLSSPFSGPKRYDYDPEHDEWVYARDGRSLNGLLNEELSDALDRKVDLGLANVSEQAS